MHELIPAFGRAARITGAIMEVHYFSVSVRARSGYISFLDIIVFKAFHASACDDLPSRNFVAQLTAARRRELIIFVFFPAGDIQRPSISDSLSQFRRVNEMNSLSVFLATRSKVPMSASLSR